MIIPKALVVYNELATTLIMCQNLKISTAIMRIQTISVYGEWEPFDIATCEEPGF